MNISLNKRLGFVTDELLIRIAIIVLVLAILLPIVSYIKKRYSHRSAPTIYYQRITAE